MRTLQIHAFFNMLSYRPKIFENLRLQKGPVILVLMADSHPPETSAPKEPTSTPAPAASGSATPAAGATPAAAAAPAPKFEAKKQAKVAATAVKNYFIKKGSSWSKIWEMFPGLVSYDEPTRKMSAVFLVSLVGALMITGIVVQRYWEARKAILVLEAKQQAQRLKELLKKEADEARYKASLLNLGQFLLELKEMKLTSPFASPKVRNQVNMAEVEIILLCDGGETREWIEKNSVQVRNQLTNVFTSVDREELLSRDGKRKIKSIIIRKLNDWLPHGKVEDVYFSRLIIS